MADLFGALRPAPRNGRIRHRGLGHIRPARDLFDRSAVSVARLEIHPLIDSARIAPERVLDQAGALEKLLPRQRCGLAEIGDRTGHAFGRFETERIPGPRRERKTRPHLTAKHRRQRGDEDFDAGDAHHRGKGPQFGDGERLAPLISRNEAHRARQRELQMRGPEQLLCQRIDARTGRFLVGQCRQLGVELAGHVLAHLAQGAADLIVVVEQPLGRLGGIGMRAAACLARPGQPPVDRSRTAQDIDRACLLPRYGVPFGQLGCGQFERRGRIPGFSH